MGSKKHEHSAKFSICNIKIDTLFREEGSPGEPFVHGDINKHAKALGEGVELKQMVLDDFGKNLPIDGRLSCSVEKPIRIITSDSVQAGLDQLENYYLIYNINELYW